MNWISELPKLHCWNVTHGKPDCRRQRKSDTKEGFSLKRPIIALVNSSSHEQITSEGSVEAHDVSSKLIYEAFLEAYASQAFQKGADPSSFGFSRTFQIEGPRLMFSFPWWVTVAPYAPQAWVPGIKDRGKGSSPKDTRKRGLNMTKGKY